MVPNPKDFQTSVTTIVHGKMVAFPRKKTGFNPTRVSRWLTMPSDGERISAKIPAMIIHDRKCGR